MSDILPFLPPKCADCGKPLTWIKPRVWTCYACPPPRSKPPTGGGTPGRVLIPTKRKKRAT